jgi:hypothetical protein
MKIAGFDWDDGTWPKCGEHGVSRAEIEEVLLGTPAVMADPFPGEPRMKAFAQHAKFTRQGAHILPGSHPRQSLQLEFPAIPPRRFFGHQFSSNKRTVPLFSVSF